MPRLQETYFRLLKMTLLSDASRGLPDEPLFGRLAELANQHLLTSTITIRDHSQQIILKRLSSESLDALKAGKDVFIILSAGVGYEWLVGFLSIISTGAAVVPICKFWVSMTAKTG
jgi:malonyl-CoA/methylmalonyl-CoA synthetase